MDERFSCVCGAFKKTLVANDAFAAFRQARQLADRAYLDLAGDAELIVIRGPVRVKHQTHEYVFDRKTGELLRTTDLRPTRRR
jgi:hypothetical protein